MKVGTSNFLFAFDLCIPEPQRPTVNRLLSSLAGQTFIRMLIWEGGNDKRMLYLINIPLHFSSLYNVW